MSDYNTDLAPGLSPGEPCATCVVRKGPHMSDATRKNTLDIAFPTHLYYSGTTFLCHESNKSGRTTPCVGFCRFKRARSQGRLLSALSDPGP
jgi:hypothetical protein